MRTLYIDIDEEITEVIDKLTALKGKNVLLVIPKAARILKNAVNIKILKKKADEQEKELQVFSNDEKGLKIFKKAGIKIYQGHVKKRQRNKPAQMDRLPIKSVSKQTQKKVSITEISEKTRKKKSAASMSSPQKKLQKKEHREWVKFFLFNTLRKKTLMGFTLMTIIFFGLVVYIAVPSATIYLTPASNVLEATVNITLADTQKAPHLFQGTRSHVIPSYPIELTFENTILYKTTGKVFTGSRARCNLKIYNNRNTPWTLIPQTRFHETSGVIFRSRDKVEIPASRYEILKDEEGNSRREKVAGSLIVSVEADEFDENGQVIGSRGNLPADTRFSLPGLSAFNQTLLYAKSETACRGGVSEHYGIVTAEDIEASLSKIEKELQKEAREYLVDYVDAQNVKRTEEEELSAPILVLFDTPQAIQYEMLDTQLPPNLENSQAEEFSVSGTMKVRGIAYERHNYYELLEAALLSRVHPDKVLSSIDYDSSTFNIVYSDSDLEQLSKVKMSVGVRGLEEYNFDPRSPKGEEIIDRILQYIPGKSKIESHYFIANLEEIQKAHISIWPFWKNDLPQRDSSITIKVQ